jgi:acetate---CoA ligase (ADP-forming)
MDFFFNPRAVALVGASQKRTGANLVHNLRQGYKGEIYPVNPNYRELGGLACHASLAEVPGAVDMAIALVPARFLPQVLADCAAKGVKGVMIQSAGFAEAGQEGLALQKECLAIAHNSGMRLWGPNCMGLVDVFNRRFFTFMHPSITETLNNAGRVSLVVQSGMLSAAFLAEMVSRRSLEVNKVCSIGNKCDVDECDLLPPLIADENTDAIGLYLESLPRGRLFLELAAASPKPLVVLKAGISQRGARAALSHTASLAGDARLTLDLLRDAGVFLAKDFHHMMDLTRSLAMASGLSRGSRVAIMTFSGGSGIVACDLLEQHGMTVAELSPQSLEVLKEIYPPWMPPANPIDIYPAMERVGRMEAFAAAAQAAFDDPQVDFLMIHHFIGLEDEGFELKQLKEMADAAGKAVAFWGIGFEAASREFEREAGRLGIPVYSELTRAVECLAVAASWQGPRDQRPLPVVPPRDTRPAPPQKIDRSTSLDEFESKALLAGWGLPMVPELVAQTLAQARDAAGQWGYPLVLKGLLPEVVHKSEMGLVEPEINGPEQLEQAFDRLSEKLAGQGRILVQPKVKADYELIVGYLRDPSFGDCLMLGLGGLLAELVPDVAFGLAPLRPGGARDMLQRLRASDLFQGFRGLPPLDLEALADLLAKLGQGAAASAQVEQVDINPLLISGGKPIAVDATVVLCSEPDEDEGI